MELDAFMAAALACPEAEQSAHHHMIDFRVRKKVFATFDPKTGLAGLNLLPEQQSLLMTRSAAFVPANGIWGQRGWTKIRLEHASDTDGRDGLMMSWAKTAPKSLVKAQKEG